MKVRHLGIEVEVKMNENFVWETNIGNKFFQFETESMTIAERDQEVIELVKAFIERTLS